MAATLSSALRAAADPLVVDLGYGASAVTSIELASRLRAVRSDIRVIGLEIDADRVAAALPWADPPWLDFRRGGFELAGLRPALVRAGNVLRQYDEAAAAAAWQTMLPLLADLGVLVDGTCDELGRRGTWILLDRNGPRSLTLAARVSDLRAPSDLAERLPKALIHHNVPGQRIHDLFTAFDAAWRRAAPLATFGAEQRWVAACEALTRDWPVLDRRNRWRFGELTVAWDAVRRD